jgi:hypothetical protein
MIELLRRNRRARARGNEGASIFFASCSSFGAIIIGHVLVVDDDGWNG